MSDAVVVAVVTAVGVVLAALITALVARSDRRGESRYEALSHQLVEVDHRLTTLDGEIRFELADTRKEVTTRIDRLYDLLVERLGSPSEPERRRPVRRQP